MIETELIIKFYDDIPDDVIDRILFYYDADRVHSIPQIKIHNLYVNPVDRLRVKAELTADPAVEYVSNNRKVELYSTAYPNDPLYTIAPGGHTHLDFLRIPEAWDITTGSDIIIGSCDTGVRLDHPDLAGRLLPGVNTCYVTVTGNTTAGSSTVTNLIRTNAPLNDLRKPTSFFGIDQLVTGPSIPSTVTRTIQPLPTSDFFSRVSSPTLGPNWTAPIGMVNGFAIAATGGQAQALDNPSGPKAAIWVGENYPFSPDQWSSIEDVGRSILQGATLSGPAVRIGMDASAGLNCYFASPLGKLYKCTNGTPVMLVDSYASSYLIKIEAIGTVGSVTINVYNNNGLLLSYIDDGTIGGTPHFSGNSGLFGWSAQTLYNVWKGDSITPRASYESLPEAPTVAYIDHTNQTFTMSGPASVTAIATPITISGGSPNDYLQHGTATVGVMAANAGNGLGVTGINWKAKIVPYKVMNDHGEGTAYSVANAFILGAEAHCRLMNVSLGWGSQTNDPTAVMYEEYYPNAGILDVPYIQAAIDYAFNFREPDGTGGMLCVVACGNGGANVRTVPAWCNNVVSVGGCTLTGLHTDGNWDPIHVHVQAPFWHVASLDMFGDTFDDFFGTSAAAPQVTGILSLMLSVNPKLSPAQLLAMVPGIATMSPVAGQEQYSAYGNVDAYKAVTLAMAALEYIAPVTSVYQVTSGSLLLQAGDLIRSGSIPAVTYNRTASTGSLSLGTASSVGTITSVRYNAPVTVGTLQLVVSISGVIGAVSFTGNSARAPTGNEVIFRNIFGQPITFNRAI